MLKFWPLLADLAKYAALFRETAPTSSIQEGGKLPRQAFLDSAQTCSVETANSRLGESSSSAAQRDAELLC
jgi:hypothetical protein